jgi:hypothetical protein
VLKRKPDFTIFLVGIIVIPKLKKKKKEKKEAGKVFGLPGFEVS